MPIFYRKNNSVNNTSSISSQHDGLKHFVLQLAKNRVYGIMLSKYKTTENHGLLLSSERVIGVNYVYYYEVCLINRLIISLVYQTNTRYLKELNLAQKILCRPI